MSDMDPLKKRPPKLLLLPVISTGKASRSSVALTPHAVNTHHDFLPRPDFPGRNRHLSSSVLPGLSALCRRSPSTFIPLVLCQSQQHSLGGPTTLLPPFVFMHRRTLSFLIYRLISSNSFSLFHSRTLVQKIWGKGSTGRRLAWFPKGHRSLATLC